MRILFLHNRYIYRGGEDESRQQEIAMLRKRGEEVIEHVLDNATIKDGNLVKIGLDSVWNSDEAKRVAGLLRSTQADVLKVDNFYPLFSPAIFHAAKQIGVPTVLSVRNYRLVCPSANIFREGHVCTLCVGKKIALPAVRYRCYRGSLPQTAAVVTSNAFAHLRGVWSSSVDRYVAVSAFVKDLLVRGGFPANRITIKPNFISDTGVGEGNGGYALYVGRLTEEKGIPSLLAAWNSVSPALSLRIIGDGPLEPAVRQAAAANPRIEFLGRQSLDFVCEDLGRAAMLVFPSVWYEPFGRSVIEAYSKGTPVIAAATPPMQAMIRDGQTGLLYQAGDSIALAAAVNTLVADPAKLASMRQNARARYLEAFTEEQNYSDLMAIFHAVIASQSQPAA